MQVHNNISFGSIYRTVIPPTEFSKAGQDVAKSVLMPFAKKISNDVKIFVGGPKYLAYRISTMEKNGEDIEKYLKATGAKVPDYFSMEAHQPVYIVTGKEDISKIGDFLEIRKTEDAEARKRFGAFGEFMENAADFERKFKDKIQDIDFLSGILKKS